jgi:hypothetical protein
MLNYMLNSFWFAVDSATKLAQLFRCQFAGAQRPGSGVGHEWQNHRHIPGPNWDCGFRCLRSKNDTTIQSKKKVFF